MSKLRYIETSIFRYIGTFRTLCNTTAAKHEPLPPTDLNAPLCPIEEQGRTRVDQDEPSHERQKLQACHHRPALPPAPTKTPDVYPGIVFIISITIITITILIMVIVIIITI